MTDAVVIRGLRAEARIGAFDWEREEPQGLAIDLILERDLSAAGASDDLTDTIDYGAVADTVVRIAGEGEANLLENLAERLAAVLFKEHDVERVTVEITKLKPPMEQEVDSVSVRIVRTR